jgi:hypothetical protein
LNTSYNSLQNHLSSWLLSSVLKNKNIQKIILLVVLHDYEIWSLPLTEQYGLRMSEKWVLRRTFGHKMEEVTQGGEQLHNLYISPDMIREVEVDEMGAAYSTNGSDQK